MSYATYLGDLAQGILDTCSEALSIDRTGREPPARQNLSWGNPPADTFDRDGQLTVTLDPVGQGGSITHVSQNPRQDSLIVPRATFTVTLMRPVPTPDAKGNPPKAEDLTASAQGLMNDLWSMLTAIYDALHANNSTDALFPSQCLGCDDIKLGRIDMIQPSGGAGGFNIRIETVLGDRGPVITS